MHKSDDKDDSVGVGKSKDSDSGDGYGWPVIANLRTAHLLLKRSGHISLACHKINLNAFRTLLVMSY